MSLGINTFKSHDSSVEQVKSAALGSAHASMASQNISPVTPQYGPTATRIAANHGVGAVVRRQCVF
jgi:hypothetical protein